MAAVLEAISYQPHVVPPESALRRCLFSTDHKTIGIQFLFLGLAFMVIGGLLAMLVRWQLAWPTPELQEKHPVPILGRLLWPQFKSDAALGTIRSIEATTGIVVIGDAAVRDSTAGDTIRLLDDHGATVTTAKVLKVTGDSVIAKTAKPANVATLRIKAAATGKLVPGVMPPDFYTMAFTMHATIMIFFVIIVLLVGAFGNYLIPLQIGAADMAFPFMNGLAFWSAVPAGAILVTGFFLSGGAAGAGWTSYPPLSGLPQNAGVGDAAGNLFQIVHSTWTIAPIIINLLAQFALAAYVCTYFVRFASAAANAIVSVILSAIFAILLIRGIQQVAYDGQSCWFLALFWIGFSSMLGAINYLTTIVKLRCRGMSMFRLPMTTWSLFITSILVLLATPVLAGTLLMNLLDHQLIRYQGQILRLTSFFEPYGHIVPSNAIDSNSGGGFAILHQHLFWFYSHPAVYIMILPAMGMVSDILSTFSRKPLFGYRPMIYALAGIAFLGFIVWAHHMFQSGMNPTLGTTFAVSTMFIAVPSAIKTFNWLGTLWGGNIRFTVPMLNALAFVAMFVVGGLSGIFMASTAVDVHIHDTYFIVAHIHYVLFGGSMFGIFAAITFWYPKMFGRMMNGPLGYVHFFLTFIFFNGTFLAMHILGLGGMPRRVASYMNYTSFAHFQPMNEFISICAFALGLSQILFVINFLGSWLWGAKAAQNPWECNTLEWTDAASPPPHGNFQNPPVVHHGAYEYSSPLVEEDWLPQTSSVGEGFGVVMRQ